MSIISIDWGWWGEAHTIAVRQAKEAGLEVREYPVSGGVRAEMVIDPALQNRINECANKIREHRLKADSFQIEADAYASQSADRFYELDPEDIVYFRLAGGPRPE